MRAAGATGTGAAAIRRGAGVGSSLRAGLQRIARVEGDTRPHSGRSSQGPPTRRRLMGLGDKTATARRPELAGQPSARSVIPFVETVISNQTPGEGPALRPALQTSLRPREGEDACPPYLPFARRIATSGATPHSDEPEGRTAPHGAAIYFPDAGPDQGLSRRQEDLREHLAELLQRRQDRRGRGQRLG